MRTSVFMRKHCGLHGSPLILKLVQYSSEFGIVHLFGVRLVPLLVSEAELRRLAIDPVVIIMVGYINVHHSRCLNYSGLDDGHLLDFVISYFNCVPLS